MMLDNIVMSNINPILVCNILLIVLYHAETVLTDC